MASPLAPLGSACAAGPQPRAHAGSVGWHGLVVCVISAVLLSASLPHVGAQAAWNDQDDWADIQGLALGDYWNYKAIGPDVKGTIQNEVAARETKTNHHGVSVDSWRIDSVGDLRTSQGQGAASQQIDTDTQSSKWVRASDYATVQIEGITRIADAKDATTLMSFDPPLVEDIYPYNDKYSWSAETSRYIEQGDEDPREERGSQFVRVLGQDEVRVDAGTFQVWVVEVEFASFAGGTAIRYYSEEACEFVKEERFDKEGDSVSTLELTEFQCSHSSMPPPTYDGRYVTLHSGTPRPIENGGEQGPMIVPPPTVIENGDPSSTVLWVSLGITILVGVGLVVFGRRGKGPGD